ncbi:Hpt domain-containing protein [Lacimicrobium alkaliphilum]|uniref:HPt domain-containing protein n=1 Tax=Lacimicrobium alkaliphilum TaxID=1526571 RepID=A0A0U3ALF4_9ALTE|nr:Hpt domain-containing protein [Lacimicrobium alkaliphilum]ALS99617.1 hypothetical protein AT746_16020 [Lacimicrobium alkaliphilum]
MADQHEPVFNICILQSQYEGMSPGMQAKALQLFLTQGTQYCDGINDFASQPRDEVFRCYHSLKTMCAMVGAMELRQLCIRFENASEDAERRAICEQLQQSWLQTEQAIQQALKEFPDN